MIRHICTDFFFHTTAVIFFFFFFFFNLQHVVLAKLMQKSYESVLAVRQGCGSVGGDDGSPEYRHDECATPHVVWQLCRILLME